MLPVFYESPAFAEPWTKVETLAYAAFSVIVRIRALENAFAQDWQNLRRRPTKAHISPELMAEITAHVSPDARKLIQSGLHTINLYRDVYVEQAEKSDCLVLIEVDPKLRGESVIVFGPESSPQEAS